MKGRCKHKNIISFRTYEPGDCYYYRKRCKDCKKESGAWTPEEAERKWQEQEARITNE